LKFSVAGGVLSSGIGRRKSSISLNPFGSTDGGGALGIARVKLGGEDLFPTVLLYLFVLAIFVLQT